MTILNAIAEATTTHLRAAGYHLKEGLDGFIIYDKTYLIGAHQRVYLGSISFLPDHTELSSGRHKVGDGVSLVYYADPAYFDKLMETINKWAKTPLIEPRKST